MWSYFYSEYILFQETISHLKKKKKKREIKNDGIEFIRLNPRFRVNQI